MLYQSNLYFLNWCNLSRIRKKKSWYTINLPIIIIKIKWNVEIYRRATSWPYEIRLRLYSPDKSPQIDFSMRHIQLKKFEIDIISIT